MSADSKNVLVPGRSQTRRGERPLFGAIIWIATARRCLVTELECCLLFVRLNKVSLILNNFLKGLVNFPIAGICVPYQTKSCMQLNCFASGSLIRSYVFKIESVLGYFLILCEQQNFDNCVFRIRPFSTRNKRHRNNDAFKTVF